MGAVSGRGDWLDLFKSLDLPATILLNSEVCDHSPSLVEAFKIAGYEIAAHGRTNSESEAGLDEGYDRALIKAANDTIGSAVGTPPFGWLS